MFLNIIGFDVEYKEKKDPWSKGSLVYFSKSKLLRVAVAK